MARTTINDIKNRRLASTSKAERAEFDLAYEATRLAITVGEQVRNAREAAGLSQRDLAARMGTSQAAVARLEAGGVGATLTTLQKVATALDLRVAVELTRPSQSGGQVSASVQKGWCGPSALLITVDTNQMDSDRVARLREVTYVEHEIACITVSSRERGTVENVVFSSLPETGVWGESRWDEAVWGPTLAEPFVIGESPIGSGVLGSEESVEVFEAALRIISGGSFPPLGLRENLTNGQLRQLRDAMIFDAHVRERRDVLITDDAKGFVNGGRRELLEALGHTRICTWSEYEALASERRLDQLSRCGDA